MYKVSQKTKDLSDKEFLEVFDSFFECLETENYDGNDKEVNKLICKLLIETKNRLKHSISNYGIN